VKTSGGGLLVGLVCRSEYNIKNKKEDEKEEVKKQEKKKKAETGKKKGRG
jgi:hypothetical protein